jgi:short subunit dehydrogenase-like uncharacterized protein
MKDKKLLFLGASGVTGRLALKRMLALGCQVTIAGRSAKGLSSLKAQHPSVEVELLDARDRPRLEELLRSHSVLVSCAGPYGESGLGVIEAAIATGTHYIDCSWEQAFIRRVQDYDEPAKQAGVSLLTGFGVSPGMSDYLFHQLMGRFDAIDDVDIFYMNGMGNPTLSFGTLLTTVAIIGQGGLTMEGGALVPMRVLPRATKARFRQKFGEQPVVAFPGASVITISKAAKVGNIRHALSLEGMTRLLPWLGKLRAESRALGFALRAVIKVVNAIGRFGFAGKKGFSKMIVVEGSASGRPVRASLSVVGEEDPYTYTAGIMALAAARLLGDEATIARGVCSVGRFFKGTDLVRELKLTVEGEVNGRDWVVGSVDGRPVDGTL